MTQNNRYDGKPMLRLAELYVLWTINEISEQDEANTQALTPKLRALFNHDGQWYEIIPSVLGLPETAGDEIRRIWATTQESLAAENVSIPPQAFAEKFVDDNFTV